MAVMHEIGACVNDGERAVLIALREGLDEDWHVISNFEVTQGARAYECDALVVGPHGWAYLIETKAWTGQIRGNDQQWELPSMVGGEAVYRFNPVSLTNQKAKIVRDFLTRQSPVLKLVQTQPLVVLVSDIPPHLEGACAASTVLIEDVIATVQIDPRPYKPKKPIPVNIAASVAETLTENARPIAPSNIVGSWKLEAHEEIGDAWEIWSARPLVAPEGSPIYRLKRYWLDTLAIGADKEDQRKRVRRDLDALNRLAGVKGAVPIVGSVEEHEDSLIVVTSWPAGESFASMLQTTTLDAQEAESAFKSMARALAAVHAADVIHRNITPSRIYYTDAGEAILTDFDYARLPATAQAGLTQIIDSELDGDYVAPEVRASAADASKASDVWSLARVGLDLFGVDLDELDRLPEHLTQVFSAALAVDPQERTRDAEVLLASLEAPAPRSIFEDGFRPNDVIEDRFVVRPAQVGKGGIARVYRVFDTLTDRDFAAKFVMPQFLDRIDPNLEYKLLAEIPEHPNVIRPELPMTMQSFKRGGQTNVYKAVFLLTPWIDGTTLDDYIDNQLPPMRVVQLIQEILGAIGHLHAHRLLHRDVKPQNILIDLEGTPRLVDFNVSARSSDATNTQAGTFAYLPPDHPGVGWAEDCDLYAVGVMLAELLAGRRLGGGALTWVESDDALSKAPSLRLTLTKASAASRDARYTDAGEFISDLDQALAELIEGTTGMPDAPPPEVPGLDVPDQNPYQAMLRSLFSQSRSSNVGTRGLDEFSAWAYVDTKIDRELFEQIREGQLRLVIITGNAGDGKTAFIQMVEKRIEELGATITVRPLGNGVEAMMPPGRQIVTNWDGSQDEGEVTSDEVLADFFAPFAGASPSFTNDEVRIIAINEGRLIDFLGHHVGDFRWLERAVLDLLEGVEQERSPHLAIVNLNLRALTLSGTDGEPSIVAKTLQRFSDPRLWEHCGGCQAIEACYANSNAKILAHPVAGARVAERVRRVLDIVRLRRRLHITMRDLRSALSYVVVGNASCDEIVAMARDGATSDLLSGYFYNSIFRASAAFEGDDAHEARGDRLLNQLGYLDVAKTSGPEEDGSLWALGPAWLRPDPSDLEVGDRPLLDELLRSMPADLAALSDDGTLSQARLLHASLRRKFFFDREDPEWPLMLPYTHLLLFKERLKNPDAAALAQLAEAVSRSDGFRPDLQPQHLGVRLVEDAVSAERTFVTHEMQEFQLRPVDRSALARFVEYEPELLALVHRHREDVTLEIDVDLHESLERMIRGFTPSREEMRGAWLNLRLFKQHLASMPSDQLILIGRDDDAYLIARTSDRGTIKAEKLR